MGVDESLYITTNEAALAVVATAMKKARLLLDTLIVNSFVGGLLFASGGMLHVFVQSNLVGFQESNNPGIISLLQGSLYPIGLFYVVILGVDLFNSNILFFSVGLARGAVSVIDLIISWMVSFWFNLVGNIFVCYIICNYSHVTKSANFIEGSKAIVLEKASFSFVETLIKGMAGNFFVCLAIYLQLMVKPLHVKFFALALPIFTFVTMGFTHSVADMYILIIGLINGAPISVGEVAWKVFLPGAIGNMIGGSFFGLVIPYYLHIVVVEKDIHLLKLPRYEYRDEQPELNQDSRVIRIIPHETSSTQGYNNSAVDSAIQRERDDTDSINNNECAVDDDYTDEKLNDSTGDTSRSGSLTRFPPPEGLTRNESFSNVSMQTSRLSGISRYNTRTNRRGERVVGRSPKNVFPVYGMGPPLNREKSIASGTDDNDMNNNDTKNDIAAESDMDPIEDDANYLQDNYFMNDVNNNDVNSAEFIGDKLKKILSRRSQKSNDLESQKRQPSVTGSRRLSTASMMTSIRKGRQQTRRQSMRNNLSELERRLAEAGISPKIANAANDVSGISPLPTTRSPPPPPPPQPSPPPQLIQPIPRAQVRIPTRLPIQEETSHPNSDFDDEQASSSSTVA